jgi:hypothetical protein
VVVAIGNFGEYDPNVLGEGPRADRGANFRLNIFRILWDIFRRIEGSNSSNWLCKTHSHWFYSSIFEDRVVRFLGHSDGLTINPRWRHLMTSYMQIRSNKLHQNK